MLAHEAGVKPVTLERWADGRSKPREENLLHLIRALAPEISPLFLSLAQEDFPALAQANLEQSRIATEIDAAFYKEVLQTYAKTPSPLACQRLQTLILTHALAHLDPTNVGMTIALLCCVPPRGGQKISALCQASSLSTPPWNRDQEQKRLFVGAESMAGTAVSTYQVFVADSREDMTISVNWEMFEESAVAAPILRQAKVAGALVASSARSYHFTPAHKNLVELYAHLIMLSFNPTEFYELSAIQLGVMPNIELQAPYTAHINRRATQRVAEIQSRGNGSITIHEANQRVLQDIADELLKLPGKE